MKKNILLILILFISFSVFSQTEETSNTIKSAKTRTKTLDEAFTTDTINKSIFLDAFNGFGIDPVKNAFKISRQATDSVLEADSLKPNLFRIYAYQSVQLFVYANKSPANAMSIFLPIFLIVFVIIILTHIIKTFFLRPWLQDPEKPKNDIENIEEEEEEEEEDEEVDDDGDENLEEKGDEEHEEDEEESSQNQEEI